MSTGSAATVPTLSKLPFRGGVRCSGKEEPTLSSAFGRGWMRERNRVAKRKNHQGWHPGWADPSEWGRVPRSRLLFWNAVQGCGKLGESKSQLTCCNGHWVSVLLIPVWTPRDWGPAWLSSSWCLKGYDGKQSCVCCIYSHAYTIAMIATKNTCSVPDDYLITGKVLFLWDQHHTAA